MAKIIKSYTSEEDRILDYVRNPLESISPDDSGGSSFIDPAQVLADARAEAKLKVQEAYAEGLKRGLEKGEADFAETIGNAAEVLAQLTVQLQEERLNFHGRIEEHILELVELVAAKVLQREVELGTELTSIIVRGALGELGDQESVVVRVNPNDLESIVARRADLLEQFERLNQLDIVPDESVESGGCLAESERLFIDAQLSSQLKLLIDRLADESTDGS
jgi:flagellar biosynthesis/type III secretory pathway protein FliH